MGGVAAGIGGMFGHLAGGIIGVDSTYGLGGASLEVSTENDELELPHRIVPTFIHPPACEFLGSERF